MSSPKTRTRTAAADVRDQLLVAGRRILERDGETGLTVRAVAAEAGVAPMGVYNHFDGKEGLLDAVVTDGFAEFGRAIAATDDDATARLLASGLGYRAFALANPVLYSLMFSSRCRPDDETAARAFEVLVDIIRYAQVGGLLKPGDAEGLALQVWSCVHGAVALELSGALPPGADATAVYEDVLRLVTAGLGA
ncbi:MAG TPA: TetR/AcrR family transcriptional regulator [Gordonia sp. (in: high G+C Gram-positive bacteria)]|uniref:TetR/AcrR family transcriptional regulator n=1 Tax=unclassified Gordonia (in: high G+C Gram-positive bacteria) TaxID=2657482 RepID=UPI000FBA8B9E|nr:MULTISPECIES: TetR/AcrR family transcriptional regulator [unclassified Gordonia (in: high G+C Gram-positive bacteria)]RUP37571.1 MAG: TetR/AcrR family transcriptional regulator [Gordonia sp. (in: high G+C Gram-positive bacteria)]HNP56518.1 TetR/AcrR family transcriptional regulator [Gordonia sp. (in: high G+C Gram-positive bacteria)]HRC50629.1 TetR/AcrR family transcriptional regulator [Gordonia sp. (in: high G+C Gram-positive bacteria)]